MERLLLHKILFRLLLAFPFSDLLLPSIAYTLPDKYFINCGSKSNFVDSVGRNFVGDLNAGFSIFPGKSIPVNNTDSSAGTSLLYQTGRVYKRSSFYELDIAHSGTYFLRLHFFVSPKNQANVQFNVSASGHLLLSNFIVHKNSNSPAIKEFLLTINVGKFEIHFIPSGESSLAFINAIEVFLAPENVIPDVATLIAPAGRNGTYSGLLNDCLHTIQRINVGGLSLTPENDTLWRYWIPDDRYLFDPEAAKDSEFYSARPKFQLGGATEYIAPDLVYKTAKVLNIDHNGQSNFFNITWRFNVSKNSRHLLRVHFCDIISVSLNLIVFNLYIYDQFGHRISPYEVTGQLAAPFYFDYVVVSDDSGFMNISVGPRHDSQNQTAFLNGLEIMEVVMASNQLQSKQKPKKKSHLVIFVPVGGAVLFIILIVMVFSILKCRKQKPGWKLAVCECGEGSPERIGNILPAPILNLELKIPYAEIQQTMKNPDVKLLIGEGGFGKVYEGNFRGRKVAVKRSEPGHGQGLMEFQTEVMVLSQISHRHLVSLIGYCDERSEMILVYEFMEKGSLRDHLYHCNDRSDRSYTRLSELSWKQRLEICIGAAKGLVYLHTGPAGGIIHRDVKSTNILLDEHYVAKVADFGLSKLALPGSDTATTGVKGSFGYLDPEYFVSLQLTDKSDVYSFGVVLFEVLCARPAIVNSLQREEVNLAEWGLLWHKKGQLEKIIDPFLAGTINSQSLRVFGETAEKCLRTYGSRRPNMRDVLWDLEYALMLQETAVHRETYEDSTTNASLALVLPVVQSLPSNCFEVEEYSEARQANDIFNANTSEVFSDLMADNGR